MVKPVERLWCKFNETFIKPIIELREKRKLEEQLKQERLGVGYVFSNFEPMLTKIISETMTYYHHNYPQSFYTIQAQHDIKKVYIETLRSFTKEQN